MAARAQLGYPLAMPRNDGVTLARACDVLERLAPCAAAQEWDNVGLLAGDRRARVRSALVCVDLMPAVVDEAIARGVDLAIAYHPPIFRPIARLVAPSPEMDAGVVRCLAAGIAVYSPHTALDAVRGGTSDVLARLCGGQRPKPFGGAGRVASLPRAERLGAIVARLARATGARCVSFVGDAAERVRRVIVVVGAAGSLPLALDPGPGDAIVTGEIRHHDALALLRRGAVGIALSHWSSERVGVVAFARRVERALRGVQIHLSQRDAEPFSRA